MAHRHIQFSFTSHVYLVGKDATLFGQTVSLPNRIKRGQKCHICAEKQCTLMWQRYDINVPDLALHGECLGVFADELDLIGKEFPHDA